MGNKWIYSNGYLMKIITAKMKIITILFAYYNYLLYLCNII